MEPKDVDRAPSGRTMSLLIGLLCLIWGSTWVVIKRGLEDLPPFTSCSARFLLAAATMVILAPILHRRERGARPPLWMSAVMGTTNFAGSYAIVYTAESGLPSGLTAVLWASYPLVFACVSWFLLPEERLRPSGAWGLLVGIAGVTVLMSHDVAGVGPEAVSHGALLLLSPLMVSVGIAVTKRRMAGTSSVLLNRDGLVIGAAILTAIALLTEDVGAVVWPARAIITVVYLAFVGTVAAFGIYFWLLRHTTATSLSLIPYVTPLVALLLGSALDGESIGMTTVIGAALILLGVAVTHRAEASAARARTTTRLES